jgi:hypothetical protein
MTTAIRRLLEEATRGKTRVQEKSPGQRRDRGRSPNSGKDRYRANVGDGELAPTLNR